MTTPDVADEVAGLQPFHLEMHSDREFTVRGRRRDPQGLVELHGRVENGAIVFTKLSITSDNLTVDTPRLRIGDIRAEVARQIRHESHQTEALRQLTKDWRDLPAYEGTEILKAIRVKTRYMNEARARIHSTGRLPAGRPRLSDSFLRGVAFDYLALAVEDQRRVAIRLTDRYREKLDDQDLSVNTVKSWIRRCRVDGWLAPASRGKPVADFGPRLQGWLDEVTR